MYVASLAILCVAVVAIFGHFYFRASPTPIDKHFASVKEIDDFLARGGRITELTVTVRNPKPDHPSNPYGWTLKEWALDTLESNAMISAIAMEVVSLYRPDVLFVCVLGEEPVEKALKALKKTELL